MVSFDSVIGAADQKRIYRLSYVLIAAVKRNLIEIEFNLCKTYRQVFFVFKTRGEFYSFLQLFNHQKF